MIDRKHQLPITRQAELTGISRGSVYLPKPVDPAELALMRRLDELRLKHPFMLRKPVTMSIAPVNLRKVS